MTIIIYSKNHSILIQTVSDLLILKDGNIKVLPNTDEHRDLIIEQCTRFKINCDIALEHANNSVKEFVSIGVSEFGFEVIKKLT